MQHQLNLKAGEIVEVRSREEILATLDERGRLDALPFMPEMLNFCGQRLRVFKRADKTCDYVDGWSMRRVENAVHLTNVRCDGRAHGGCEQGCMIFWKEAWLKRVGPSDPAPLTVTGLAATSNAGVENGRSIGLLERTSWTGDQSDRVFVCQTTTVKEFTSPLKWWDVRQYARDVVSGNLQRGIGSGTSSERFLERVLAIVDLIGGLIITTFNAVQEHRQSVRYPLVEGALTKTPAETLDLRPGDLVEVKSKEEILATLDRRNKNRGLLYDAEMLRYCGGIYKVLRRVEKIVDEKTGKLIAMPRDAVILDGAFCKGDFHMFCPRSIYPFWREIWLRRVEDPATASAAAVADCNVACEGAVQR